MCSDATTPKTLEELALVAAQCLIPILDDSLSTCSDRHQLALGAGADNYSYATDAWSFPKNLLAEAVADGAIPFSCEQGSGFGLRIGPFLIRHHRVGDGTTDINESFPSRGKMLQNDFNTAQAELFGHTPWAEDNIPVALAYMSSPEFGLISVHLCTISEVCEGRIIAWDQIVAVPLDVAAEASTHDTPPAAGPPPESINLPNVAFFPIDQTAADLDDSTEDFEPATTEVAFIPVEMDIGTPPPPEVPSTPKTPFVPQDEQDAHDEEG